MLTLLLALFDPTPASAQETTSQLGLLGIDADLSASALAVEQALRAGDPWEQLSWTFTLRPSLLYRRYLDERQDELVTPRLSATLQLRFGEKPVDTVRRAEKLERALQAHARAGRLTVRDALLAHAELLLAQDAWRAAATALAALPDDAPALDVQAAGLAMDTADAGLRNARTVAAGHGFRGEATYESLRFAVPEAPATAELPAMRLQQLALAEAEALYLAAGAASVIKDFRLGAAYRTGAMDLDVEVGLLAGRPGLRVGTIHPGGRTRLEFRVSAEIAVGDGLADLPRLAAEVERQQGSLEVLAGELRAAWLLAAEAAELARRELDLAEAELAEAEAARSEQLLAAAQLPSDATDSERSRMQSAVDRAHREVQRLTTRVYRAWITYVRRHADLLDEAAGVWEWAP